MRSLWLEEALRGADDAPALEGDQRADVCIVGGGYTGLWSAIRLKEHDPSLDIALVEADVCGGGASGRNGGFVLSWWAKFSSLQKVCATDEALRLARASADAVTEIGVFCDENGIDANYRRDGWLWAATSSAQLGAWDETLEALAACGAEPFRRLSREDVASLVGPTHLGGVYEPSAASVQPALLARGLRRVATESGVRIFEHSPMRRLERSRPPRVVTPQGSLTAPKVVLALNAWSVAVRELRRSLVVISSDVVATEPSPEKLEALGWTDGMCISDSRLLVNYYRTTLEGRIVFGQGGGDLAFGARVAFNGHSRRNSRVERSMRELFPSLSGTRVTHDWTGPIDRTLVGLPFFSRLGGRDDLLYGMGYSGNGVGPAYVGGRILASLALGLDDEWATAGLVRDPAGRFPPEPLRYVAGNLVRRAVERKENAEDRGTHADRVTVALASLAPAGLVPVKRTSAPLVAGSHGAPEEGTRRG